jgi:hypothetical protein
MNPWTVGERVFAVESAGYPSWGAGTSSTPDAGFFTTVVRVTPSGRAFINDTDCFTADGCRYGSYKSPRKTRAFSIREPREGDEEAERITKERRAVERARLARENKIRTLQRDRLPWASLTDEQLDTVLAWLAPKETTP